MSHQVDPAHPGDAVQTVYLSLGTNLGDRHNNLQTAIHLLQQQIVVEQISSVYETEPAYVVDQPRFLNIVCGGQTRLSPHDLLGVLKQLEQQIGRQEGIRYGPRLIDIDILVYGDMRITTPDLIIPHARLAERPFVLVPLAEIAPELVPPGFDQMIGNLTQHIHTHGSIVACLGRLVDTERPPGQFETNHML